MMTIRTAVERLRKERALEFPSTAALADIWQVDIESDYVGQNINSERQHALRLLANAYLAEDGLQDIRVLRLHAAILYALPYITTSHVRAALQNAVEETK
jgi:hypothetical protein